VTSRRDAELLERARDELAHAEHVVALLDVDDAAPAGDTVAIARGIVERDLAARRVEAWRHIVARMETAAAHRCRRRSAQGHE
jgi:hypothetical protein